MTVKVLSGNCVVDEQTFATEELALLFASEQQDAGFKVRLEGVE